VKPPPRVRGHRTSRWIRPIHGHGDARWLDRVRSDGRRSPTGPDPSAGLKLLAAEGAGEVQTPLRRVAASDLWIGDRVWFRHAKAGELSEHVDEFQLVEGGAIVGAAVTYRGEGKTFL